MKMQKTFSWFIWSGAKIVKHLHLTFIFIFLTNLMPLFGILLFKWQVFPILLFYCFEGVLVLTSGLIGELMKVPMRKNVPFGFPPLFGYTLLVVVCILGYFLPLSVMILIAVSRTENALESISNVYFVVSVGILFFNILFTTMREKLKISHNIKRQESQEKIDPIFFIIMKFIALNGITFIVVLTNFYSAALIIIAIVKAYIEFISDLKKQAAIEKVNSK